MSVLKWLAGFAAFIFFTVAFIELVEFQWTGVIVSLMMGFLMTAVAAFARIVEKIR